jgi:integrase
MQRDLTDAFLRTIKPPASGRMEIWDIRVRGLHLRMTPAGTATWALRTRTADGKQTRITLGTYPAFGIAAARKAALNALAEVHRGADPVAQKRAARAARARDRAEPTVAERIGQWQDARAHEWSARYTIEVQRAVAREVLPRLGARPLRQTTRADWVALIEGKRRAGAPGRAAFLYRTISAFLNHAEAAGWIDAPILPRRGAVKLAPPPPPRERVLTDDELRLLWRAAEAEPPKARAFTRLLILTAAREAEVAGIRAGEVDHTAAVWNLPGARTKNNRGLTLPLGDLAMVEIRAVWPADPGAETCILGRFPAAPMSGFSKLKTRLDARMAAIAAEAGMPPPAPWRFHDIRRTARSGMARLGVPNDHAEAALNHISGRPALARTYDRHDYRAEALAALRTWQGFVAGLVAEAAPVVPLAARRRATAQGVA